MEPNLDSLRTQDHPTSRPSKWTCLVFAVGAIALSVYIHMNPLLVE